MRETRGSTLLGRIWETAGMDVSQLNRKIDRWPGAGRKEKGQQARAEALVNDTMGEFPAVRGAKERSKFFRAGKASNLVKDIAVVSEGHTEVGLNLGDIN